MTQSLLVEQVALLALAAGVSYHACGAAHQCQWLVSAALEVAEHHHSAQMADMETVGSGGDAQISRCKFFFELFFGARHHVVNHAAPFKFFYKIHRMRYY